MPRLMFIKGSQPIPNARVRVDGTSGTYQTDEEGRVEIPVERERFTVDIETEAGEVRKTVESIGRDSLTVVSLTAGPTTGDEELRSTDGLGAAIRRQFGERYRYDKILGQGGMGIVVKATDELLERPVAVKVLSGELADYEEARDIFLTEARSLATFSHPNLVAVYDIDDSGRRPMMVSEFVDGKTLEEIVGLKGALGQSTVLRLGVQLTRALEYLHGEGAIHRDLKPGNVMLQDDGSLKLIDFGLARSLKKLAEKGTRVRGTPAYMAPEQLTGDRLDERVDIYQVGVTLYEACSGQLPFPDGDIAYKHVHEPAPRLDDNVPNILPGLGDVVESCMAKAPADRPASMTVLREELERLHSIVTSSRVDRDTLTNPGQQEPSPAGGTDEKEGEDSEESVDRLEPDAAESEESGRGLWIGGGVALLLLAGGVAFLVGGGAATSDESREPEAVANSVQGDDAGAIRKGRAARADTGPLEPDEPQVPEVLNRSKHVVAVAISAATSTSGTIGRPKERRGREPSPPSAGGEANPSAGKGAPPESLGASAVGSAESGRVGSAGEPEEPAEPPTSEETERAIAPTPAAAEATERETADGPEPADPDPPPSESKSPSISEPAAEQAERKTPEPSREEPATEAESPSARSEETDPEATVANGSAAREERAEGENTSDSPSVPGVGGKDESSDSGERAVTSGESESSGGEKKGQVPVSF